MSNYLNIERLTKSIFYHRLFLENVLLDCRNTINIGMSKCKNQEQDGAGLVLGLA